MQVPGVILAGGSGRRLGGVDKAGLRLAGRPLLAHMRARIEGQDGAQARAQVRPLALSARPGTEPQGLPLLTDPLPGGLGPLAGVLAAMLWAAEMGAARVLTVPIDLPFLPDDLLARLAAAGPGAVVAEHAGRLHPVVALWPVTAAEWLRAWLQSGERKAMAFAALLEPARAAFPKGEPEPFFNINTPEDLAEAEVWLTGPTGQQA